MYVSPVLLGLFFCNTELSSPDICRYLNDNMYRSESAPDFKVPETPRHTPPVFMNIREF